MKEWEANSLADKLAHSWPRSSVTIKAWEEELLELDKGRAEEAARQLVRTAEHPPSIATFLSTYRNLAGSARYDFQCPKCCNTGWVTDTNHPAHWPGKHPAPATEENGVWTQHPGDVPKVPDWYGPDDGCCCNVVTPCACDNGQRARQFNARDKASA